MLRYLSGLQVPLTFLTATLSLDSEEALRRTWRRSFHVFRSSINLPNLELVISARANLQTLSTAITPFITSRGDVDRAIIYLFTRESVSLVTQFLEKDHGTEIFAKFTGGMDHNQRKYWMTEWISGRRPVMIATSAFSLGINYPTVRLVITFGLPYSLDEYVQQIGRAGRDGKRSKAILYALEREDNSNASKDMVEFSL